MKKALSLFFISFGCVYSFAQTGDEQIYKELGLDKGGEIIKPIILPASRKKEFKTVEQTLPFEIIKEGYRGLSVTEKASGITKEVIVLADGNSEVHSFFTVDEKKKLILADYSIAGASSGSSLFAAVYDFNLNKITDRIAIDAQIYPFGDSVLCNSFKDDSWYITDYLFKTKKQNILTKLLSRYKVSLDEDKPELIQASTRCLVGTIYTDPPKIKMSVIVRWEKDFSSAEIIPLPGCEGVEMYSSGNVIKREKNGKELIFTGNGYNSSDVSGGTFSKGLLGDFVRHSEFGECYLLSSPSYPSQIFAYRLSENKIQDEQKAVKRKKSEPSRYEDIEPSTIEDDIKMPDEAVMSMSSDGIHATLYNTLNGQMHFITFEDFKTYSFGNFTVYWNLFFTAHQLSPDGKILACADFNGTLFLYRVAENELVQYTEIENAHMGFISAIAFSNDGKLIVTAGTDNTVRTWNKDGKMLHKKVIKKTDVYGIKIHPSGKIFTLLCKKEIIFCNDACQIVGTLDLSSYDVFGNFSVKGDMFVCPKLKNKKTILLKIGALSLKILQIDESGKRNIIFSPDGNYFGVFEKFEGMIYKTSTGKSEISVSNVPLNIITTSNWDKIIKPKISVR
jgi:WD40 repeat protein